MPAVPGNQIVGAGLVGAFQKHIVVRIAGHRQTARGPDEMAVIADEGQQPQAVALAHLESGSSQDAGILSENRLGDVQVGGFGDGEQERRARESVRMERSGNHDVGV